MALKTREKLIEVARQLFMRNGVENTTISDIASASDKGRRTIYTYFKNKKEIYNAVIERESEKLVSELRLICDGDSAPADKLNAFLMKKLSQTRAQASTYSLKSLMKLDFRRSDHVHKKVLEKEKVMLFDILDEGVEQGCFNAERCSLLRSFAFKMVLGLDLISFNDSSFASDYSSIKSFVEFITQSVCIPAAGEQA